MMRVRGDLVLVALVPAPEANASGLVLAPALPPVMTSGRVLRAGPSCRDVQRGDLVAFPPSAGVHDYTIGTHPCVFIREIDICAVIEGARRQETSAA